MRFRREISSSVDNHKHHSDDQHRKCQHLSAGKRSQIKSDLGIRLADKLHHKTKQTIKADQRPEYRSPEEILFVNPSQNQKQHQAFENSFIELRGMARLSPPVGEHHCPGHTCCPAIQLAINEISYAPEAQADRHCDARQVCDLPKVPAFSVARNPRGGNDSNESSVKRHATLPDRKNR